MIVQYFIQLGQQKILVANLAGWKKKSEHHGLCKINNLFYIIPENFFILPERPYLCRRIVNNMRRMSRTRILLLAAIALAVLACRPDRTPETGPKTQTEWISRPDGFQQNYTLDQMVILSRHNIRSPLVSKNSVLTRLTNSNYQWFPWEGAPSTLTPKGEKLEKQMGAFFKEWLGRKDFISQYSADPNTFRFYANAKQRCQVTARSFADALLPGENPEVEMKVTFDTMDPVFNPRITKIPEGFEDKAGQEIRNKFGNLDEGIASGYALLERVIDITNAPAYPDTASFSQYPSSVEFKLNAEPSMKGGLKMACSISDALTLQYYEEADERKASFGHDLSFNDWCTISSVKEWYGDVLFTAPSVAVNAAHPLLQEILTEMQNETRVFTFLCGHDSNVASVLAALEAESYDLPLTIEKHTPIGCKLIFESFTGADGTAYADILMVYASTEQLRAECTLSYENPPAVCKIKLKGLKENPDGLYSRSDVMQRFAKAIEAYDKL